LQNEPRNFYDLNQFAFQKNVMVEYEPIDFTGSFSFKTTFSRLNALLARGGRNRTLDAREWHPYRWQESVMCHSEANNSCVGDH